MADTAPPLPPRRPPELAPIATSADVPPPLPARPVNGHRVSVSLTPATPPTPQSPVAGSGSTSKQTFESSVPLRPMSDPPASHAESSTAPQASLATPPRTRPPVPRTPSRSTTSSRRPSNASNKSFTLPSPAKLEVKEPTPARTEPPPNVAPSSIGPLVGKLLDNRPVPSLPVCLMLGTLLLLAYLRVGFILLTLAVGTCWYLWADAEKTNAELGGKARSNKVPGRVHAENKEESADWINHALYALFPLISTDLLTPFIDLLEDALLEQVPPIVTSVRLVSPSLGSQPLQLTAMRPLSDAEWFNSISESSAADNAHRSASSSRRNSTSKIHDQHVQEAGKRRRRDRILRQVGGRRGQGAGRGNNPSGKKQATAALEEQNGETKMEDDEDSEEDPDAGQYVNYEVKFVYDASTLRREGWGIHMLAYFGMGVKGVGGGEVPVHIDMLTITGTLNLRLLLSPSPPFVRTGTFSFPKLPDFDLAARPLKKVGWGSVNVMELPLVKSYMMKSVAEVAQGFVRPSSYTMDLDRLLLGKEASLRTSAIGVLQIQLHGATDLPKADTMGSCDPYVTVSLTKFKKPTFSTRTIINSRSPLWAETAFVLIDAASIEAGENLQLRVCDSDRFSADDALGLVELDLADLVEESERLDGRTDLQDRHDPLQPTHSGLKTSGYLDWSVRFCPLWKMSPEEIEDHRPQIHTPKRSLPGDDDSWWMKKIKSLAPDTPSWEEARSRERKETLAWFTGERQRDSIESQLKPRLDLRSGVLQFHIHQCMDLEVEHLGGSYASANRSGNPAAGGRPALEEVVDVTSWESESPPSAYCEIILNDKVVYRTRTKQALKFLQLTPAPYFNALGERFLRDWTKARLVVVIRDERDREHDPILGMVVLDLVDVLSSSSQVTRTFPIVGGIGWGHLRLSLLFKTVDVSLPLDVSGYEVATLDVKSLIACDLTSLCNGKAVSIVLETEADSFTLSPPDDAGSMRPSMEGGLSASSSRHSMPAVEDLPELEWDIDRRIRLAVEYRQSCSLVIRFLSKSGLKKKTVALAMVRLHTCPDSDTVVRTAPVYMTSDLNTVAEDTFAREQGRTAGHAEPIGEVTLELMLRPGISRAHKKLTRRDKRFKHVYEAWEAAVEVGARIRLTDQDKAAEAMEKSEGHTESDDDDDAQSLSRPRSAGSFRSNRSKRDSDGDSLVEPGDDKNAFAKWRDHSKALHRQQKGIFQLKVVRTSKFVKDKLQEKILSTKLAVGGDLDKRRPRGNDMEIEKEGQSTL